MEDKVAPGDSGEDGSVVGDVAVGEIEGRVGRQGGEVRGPPDQHPDIVALVQQGGAEPSAQETGRAGHQDLH